MFEQYITIGRAQFFSLTAYARQKCTIYPTSFGTQCSLILDRSYSSQYSDFPSFLFCPFVSDKDVTYLLPTDTPWHQPPAHGDATAMSPALTPTRAWQQDTNHTGRLGLWYGAGHPGGGTRFFWCDAADRDENTVRGLLTW